MLLAFELSGALLTGVHTQARIALLEGERRSFDNVKLDLMRRIKMLEYALRVERYVGFCSSDVACRIVFDVSCASSKQLTQPSSVPPAKLATIQSQTGGASGKEDTYSHKEGSSGSSPRSEGASYIILALCHTYRPLTFCRLSPTA